jgi:hypothetical protein
MWKHRLYTADCFSFFILCFVSLGSCAPTPLHSCLFPSYLLPVSISWVSRSNPDSDSFEYIHAVSPPLPAPLYLYHHNSHSVIHSSAYRYHRIIEFPVVCHIIILICLVSVVLVYVIFRLKCCVFFSFFFSSLKAMTSLTLLSPLNDSTRLMFVKCVKGVCVKEPVQVSG